MANLEILRLAYYNGHIAQWLEHRSYKAGVDGSNPSMPTIKNKRGS